MITHEQLKKLAYLRQEIEYVKQKIDNYKPAEIVVDSVRGSSPFFPYTEHSVRIEGIEEKKDKLGDYYRRLAKFQQELEEEERKIDLELQSIRSPEIRQIIRLHYIDGLTYVQIMHKMNYNAPETPRMKLFRFLGGNYEQD